MNRPPAFLLYANDWLSSTKISIMTPAEEGAYIRLLCYCWNDPDCTIPDDDDQLAILSRLGEGWFKGGSTKLRTCFSPHTRKPGRLFNVRLLAVFTSLQKFRRAKQRAGHVGGVKSGLSRRQIKRNTIEAELKQTFDSASSKPEAKRTSSSSSSSSSSKEKKEDTDVQASSFLPEQTDQTGPHLNGHAWQDGFDKFWAAYPKKQHKGDAEQWFKSHRPKAELVAQMLTTIAAFKASAAWRKDDGKWVPLPGKWLDKQCWADVVRVDVPRQPVY